MRLFLLAGSSACTVAPPVAAGVQIEELVLGQNTGVVLIDAGAPVRERMQPVISGRDAQLRLVLEADEARDVIVEVALQSETLSETVSLEGGRQIVELALPGAWLVEGDAFRLSVLEADGVPRSGDASGAMVPGDGSWLGLGVRDIPPLRVVLVDLDRGADLPRPDLSDAHVQAIEARLYAMFPVPEVVLEVHEQVVPMPLPFDGSSSLRPSVYDVMDLRTADGVGDDTLYVGLYGHDQRTGPGTASDLVLQPGQRTAIAPSTLVDPTFGDVVIVHEIGHLLGALHAPCGTDTTDPNYPFEDGSIGVRAWNGLEERWVLARQPDVMSYCADAWMGPYTGGQLAAGLLWPWD